MLIHGEKYNQNDEVDQYLNFASSIFHQAQDHRVEEHPMID
jgi:hypothetical protein